jgi:hypothetical protein
MVKILTVYHVTQCAETADVYQCDKQPQENVSRANYCRTGINAGLNPHLWCMSVKKKRSQTPFEPKHCAVRK